MATARRFRVPRTKSEEWGGGDRIGKIAGANIRELMLRAEIYGEMPKEPILRVLAIADEMLDILCEEENDPAIVVEEMVDTLKRVIEKRNTAVQEQEDREKACDEQIADIQASKDDALKDHEEDMRALSQTTDEYRRRAELAEHELEVLKRTRDGSDIDARDALEKRIAELEAENAKQISRAVALEKDLDGWIQDVKKIEHALANEQQVVKLLRDAHAREVEELEKALAHARAVKPIKVRKAKR